jgi:hypothetical protein
MGVTTSVVILAFVIATTVVLLLVSLAVPTAPKTPALYDDDGHPRIRLLSRVLFSRRQTDAITIDCLLVAVEQAGPDLDAPEGLPFTLQLRTPETGWFADRVEQLLEEWAGDSRELLLELREDHGRVRTMIASGSSSVHLELTGAAGLSLTA